jgi:hypothetical protein
MAPAVFRPKLRIAAMSVGGREHAAYRAEALQQGAGCVDR